MKYILDHTNKPYAKLFEDIRPIGAHYGNEIGFFMSNMPWLDMILLVATHYAAHTPDEKLNLASFDHCYKALVEILARL